MTGMKRPPAPPAAPDLGTARDALQHAGALFRGGHFLDAAAIYRDVIRRRPRLPDVHNNLGRSEEHTSELQSLMRISYAVFRLKKKKIVGFNDIMTNGTSKVRTTDHRCKAHDTTLIEHNHNNRRI